MVFVNNHNMDRIIKQATEVITRGFSLNVAQNNFKQFVIRFRN